MPEARVLISDLTGGEVSPRVDARADLERYGRSCREMVNFLPMQQGGAAFRQGTEHVGLAAANGLPDPIPIVLVEWRAGGGRDADIVFELSGNTVRGWTNAGLVLVSGAPYTVTLPAGVVVSQDLQWSQRGRQIVLTGEGMPPLVLTVDGVASWSVAALPVALYPRREFRDALSPPRQNSVTDLTFVGFSAGNTFNLYVDGEPIIGARRVDLARARTFSQLSTLRISPLPVAYIATSTTDMAERIRRTLVGSELLPNDDEVTVAFVSGTTYRVTLSGESGGRQVTAAAQAESASIRIEVATNAAGRGGAEAAWSYPTVVLHSGVYYQCLAAHVSTATAPPAAPSLWEPLAGPPAWEAVQPSATWSSASISYGPGGRGFPAACCFHQQRLFLGGSPFAPQALWGSAIGDLTNFVLGAEDDTALSRDIDAQDAPAIRWLASQQGLFIGTSAGVWVATAQVTLTPADVTLTPLTGDRCAAIRPVAVGNEVLFVSEDRTQLLTVRRNAERGPWESVELSALAEHLGRRGLRRLAYSHQPQPVVYALTDDPALVLAIAYSRQNDMVAFARLEFDADVVAMTTLFAPGVGDRVWLVMNRATVAVERLPYPVTGAPLNVPDTTATVHLDGWVRRTAGGGVAGGLLHLGGQTVTILNADGSVQGTGVVTVSATVFAPVTVDDPSFEDAGLTDWTVTGSAAVTSSTAQFRTGARSLRLGLGAAAVATVRHADNFAVTPGATYRLSSWWLKGQTALPSSFEPVVIEFYDAGATLLLRASVAFVGTDVAGSTSTWTQAEVTAVAPLGASYARIGCAASNGLLGRVMFVDDVVFAERPEPTATVPATGANLVIGRAFTGRIRTMEPVAGWPAGPATGRTKRYGDLAARLYQSALPTINGDRPSDYDEPGGYRANPGRLRTGTFAVNSSGWGEAEITIEQDLPHRTEIVALYGDLKVN